MRTQRSPADPTWTLRSPTKPLPRRRPERLLLQKANSTSASPRPESEAVRQSEFGSMPRPALWMRPRRFRGRFSQMPPTSTPNGTPSRYGSGLYWTFVRYCQPKL